MMPDSNEVQARTSGLLEDMRRVRVILDEADRNATPGPWNAEPLGGIWSDSGRGWVLTDASLADDRLIVLLRPLIRPVLLPMLDDALMGLQHFDDDATGREWAELTHARAVALTETVLAGKGASD